jgi:hypothetical protein
MAHNRLICDRAVYDWSFNDPRTLVYFQQQRMRGQLLDKAAAETRRSRWWATCLSSVASTMIGVTVTLRAVCTGRATSVSRASQPAPAPAGLVPSAI